MPVLNDVTFRETSSIHQTAVYPLIALFVPVAALNICIRNNVGGVNAVHFHLSITELNAAIREKLNKFNTGKFQKKDGSRALLFREDEVPLLSPLPAEPFELSGWKEATVQFNYHVSSESMWYSVLTF